ncbi:MAG: hypothetical protein HY694_03050 [Deltaproteobacteria bacterium]|nr:hypothetical protein [Deltaproteobacteria bacterium]
MLTAWYIWKPMGGSLLENESGLPEKLVNLLLSHLKRHALWDSLLMFSPPLLVVSYLVVFLYGSVLITQQTLIFAAPALLGVVLLVGLVLRDRRASPTLFFAARLIDDRVEGKNRFVTLATIDPIICPSFLLARLRREAAGLLHRIDLKKDFPYRVKRSFFLSFAGSLVLILLFHLFLQIALLFEPQRVAVKELAPLAQRLSQVPRFSALARSLEEMAVRIQNQDLSSAEKLSSIQEMLKNVENQLGAERQKGGDRSDLLSQTADALRGLEQGLGEGQEPGGAGGLKTNLPEEREGRGRESAKGSGGEGQGDLGQSGSRDLKGERSAQREKGVGQGQDEGDEGRGDKLKGEKERGREIGGVAKGELEGKGGKGKGEEVPRGTTPDRFLQPGEQGDKGLKGLKGARFVTVELPEVEAEGSGVEGASGKRRGLRPKVPVSNMPLRRPDSPDASTEKQPLPLEYRKLIR